MQKKVNLKIFGVNTVSKQFFKLLISHDVSKLLLAEQKTCKARFPCTVSGIILDTRHHKSYDLLSEKSIGHFKKQ